MAYKFQMGAAVLSGAVDQEGEVTVMDGSKNIKVSLDTTGEISGSGNFRLGGEFRADNLGSITTIAEASDFVMLYDADANKMQKNSFASFLGAVDGNGLTVASSQLAIDLDGTSLTVGGSGLKISEDGVDATMIDFGTGADQVDTDVLTEGSTNLYFTNTRARAAISLTAPGGAPLAYNSTSGVFTLSAANMTSSARTSVSAVAEDFIEYTAATGKIGIDPTKFTGSFAVAFDTRLAAKDTDDLSEGSSNLYYTNERVDDRVNALVTAGSGISKTYDDAGNSLTLAADVSGSALSILSGKLGISGSIAGDALSRGAGDGMDSIRTLNVVADETTIESLGLASLRVKDGGIDADALASSVAGAGLTGGGGSALAVVNASNGGILVAADSIAMDIQDLDEQVVDITADFFAFSDEGTVNDPTKKDSIADLIAAMAGAGLTQNAVSKKLDVQGNAVASKADGDTLAEGYNYFADIGGGGSSAAVTLPAAAASNIGDVVTVKAGDLDVASGKTITINRAGSAVIDSDLTSIVLESPYAAVTLVVVAENEWRIV